MSKTTAARKQTAASVSQDGFGDAQTGFAPVPLSIWRGASVAPTHLADQAFCPDQHHSLIPSDAGVSDGGTPVQALHRRALEGASDHQVLTHILVMTGNGDQAEEAAYRLLRHGQSLAGVVDLPIGRLKMLAGLEDQQILGLRLMLECAARIAQARIVPEAELNSTEALAAYCTIRLARESKPGVRLLYLDGRHRLILDEGYQGQATDGTVPLHPRRIMRRAVELDASAIVVARGDVAQTPAITDRDSRIIAKLLVSAEVLGIELFDYLLIGAAGYHSWRDAEEAAIPTP